MCLVSGNSNFPITKKKVVGCGTGQFLPLPTLAPTLYHSCFFGEANKYSMGYKSATFWLVNIQLLSYTGCVIVWRMTIMQFQNLRRDWENICFNFSVQIKLTSMTVAFSLQSQYFIMYPVYSYRLFRFFVNVLNI